MGGTGAITGGLVNVNAGGTLAPGASIESLATPSVNMQGAYAYELNSSALLADLTVVSASFNIVSGATLGLTDLAPAAVAVGTKFTLVNASMIGGTFTGYADDSLFTLGPNQWLINYNDTSGGTNFAGEQVANQWLTITAVPEASAFLAVGLAAAVAGVRVKLARRRTAKQAT